MNLTQRSIHVAEDVTNCAESQYGHPRSTMRYMASLSFFFYSPSSRQHCSGTACMPRKEEEEEALTGTQYSCLQSSYNTYCDL